MRFQLVINMNNAAYEDGFQNELIDNLSGVAEDISEGKRHGYIFDINGNRVGYYRTIINDGELND